MNKLTEQQEFNIEKKIFTILNKNSEARISIKWLAYELDIDKDLILKKATKMVEEDRIAFAYYYYCPKEHFISSSNIKAEEGIAKEGIFNCTKCEATSNNYSLEELIVIPMIKER